METNAFTKRLSVVPFCFAYQVLLAICYFLCVTLGACRLQPVPLLIAQRLALASACTVSMARAVPGRLPTFRAIFSWISALSPTLDTVTYTRCYAQCVYKENKKAY